MRCFGNLAEDGQYGAASEVRKSGIVSEARGFGGGWEILSENVKEHATLSARARIDHGVEVEFRERHVNRAADRGCVSRLVRIGN